MGIEKNWQDCIIYLVGFRSKKMDGEERLINKTLIFDSEKFMEKQERIQNTVEEFVFENFSNVLSIEYIDLWNDDALRLR